ncbi:hypothetical protein J7F03_20780 [Streptomyces sp. ISL-43]|uniref:hypothetical protein n=1 Tax=Streptomyces sp. ISL-43 TaxID=2819183 RepID=UPI001BE7562E|nr:hypothetical protein [Streptomyces sp. ISL-43]MBT2449479.1 hypothetical protein [Streptomyces sp. ISL-43]
MSTIPGWLLRYTITIEAYIGETAYGPQYAAPVTARAYTEETTRTARTKEGEEITSTATKIWLFPDQECPPESRVTLPSGRVASVITSTLYSGAGLPTPDHREVTCT